MKTKNIDILQKENLELHSSVERYMAELKKSKRESQVEAALERVRARTMAMQKSDELKEVIQVVYDQFVHLKVNVEHTGFIMDYKERDDMHIWLADRHEVPSELFIPYFDSSHWNCFREAKAKRTDFFPTLLDFEEKNSFYKDLFALIPDLPEETIDYYFSCPGLAGSTVLLDNVSLYIENFQGVPYSDEENQILMRFGKVFQQTYTRFIDLQKAEAQTREAQIEAALERVRAQSMGMHESDGLTEVVREIGKGIHELGIDTHNSQIFTNYTDDPIDGLNIWVDVEGQNYLEKFHIPYIDHLATQYLYEALNEGRNFFGDQFSRSDKDSYFKLVLNHSDLKRIPEKRKELILDAPGWTRFTVVLNKSCLHFGRFNLDEFTEEEKEVFIRFGKVFSQAYTRFLDLQKAEEQARKAQIETALEKVRSRTMAMQKSDELAEVSSLMFQQLKLLRIDTYSSGFTIWDQENNELTSWMCNADGSMNPPFRMPLKENTWHKAQFEAWKQGEEFLIKDFTGEEMKAHFRYLRSFPLLDEAFKISIAAGHPMPERQVHQVANFPHGNLLFISLEPRPEAHGIFKRFAKVFEQTYTRFLDLKKAESQAREAQIEAALERVRSKTMAMHNSQDMEITVITLFDEVSKLGLDKTIRCGIGILDENTDYMETYSATSNPEGAVDLRMGMLNMNIHPMLVEIRQSWKLGKSAFQYYFDRQNLLIYYKALNDAPDYHFERNLEALPEEEYQRGFFFNEGILFAFASNPFSEESVSILGRFAAVFEQTYTRFLDLQKAEAQAREAQIEAILEKVRAQSMGMQTSEDLSKVASVMFDQMKRLGGELFAFGIVLCEKDKDTVEQWHNLGNEGMISPFIVPIDLDYIHQYRYDQWLAGEELFSIEIPEDYITEHFDLMFGLPSVKVVMDEVADQGVDVEIPDWEIDYGASFKHGYLLVSSRKPFEENNIFPRFAKVFEQAYTRFLDLKKAEEQARETQIQLALERVRARTMAMHNSDELGEVASVLFEQISSLTSTPDRFNIGIANEKDKSLDLWVTDQEGHKITKRFIAESKSSPVVAEIFKYWEKQENYKILDLFGKKLKNWIRYMGSEVGIPFSKDSVKDHRFVSVVYFSHGFIGVTTNKGPDLETINLLERFSKVFKQTYVRFLDLQKSEAQAREAQIEAALERVRSRTMGMQSSDELPEVANLLFLEVQDLGIPAWSCGYNILNDDKKTAAAWMSSEGSLQEPFKLRLYGEASFDELGEFVLSDETMLIQELGGNDLEEQYAHMKSFPDVLPQFEKLEELGILLPTYQINHLCKFSHGFLLFITYEPVPDAHDVFRRFTKIFDQTYTRFLDLKKAEAREKEGIKQASLDRVRGEIASMRTTKDLERITPVIWKELTVLGVPFFRCGVFIIREDEEMVHAYLSKPDGASVAAIHIPFDDKDNKLIEPMIKNWRLQKSYNEKWDRKQFIQQTRIFVDKGQIENPESYSIVNTPPENLVLNLVPFKQGMIYIGHQEDLTKDQISLVESLSKAFSVAYSRYEDFKAIENTKNSLELTIKDLKSTQAQLIQAEKMASLGELTAGIAHEIKNPLNFVNNFSEVSKELLEEMNEELRNGNYELVAEIAGDVNTNLEKILHHGKRADGIVKGMLQHSRSNSGKKEIIKLNNFVNEYLRLAYHGIRAKDKSFNAKMETQFAEEVGSIEAVPQELGRVILNLVTNAFYAVNEKKTLRKAQDKVRQVKDDNSYEPTVWVSTKKEEDNIEIGVRDNGNGIPSNVIDKIFQPFFTTKPTGEGTGLGLSLSYDIIKSLDGELNVKSEEGQGTIFTIRLPKHISKKEKML